MQPELVVPDLVHAGVVLAAEPPEPVAALGDEDLAPRVHRLARLVRALARGLFEPGARFGQEVPRSVVVWVADPGVEARADPAARVQPVQLLLRRMLLQEVANGGG